MDRGLSRGVRPSARRLGNGHQVGAVLLLALTVASSNPAWAQTEGRASSLTTPIVEGALGSGDGSLASAAPDADEAGERAASAVAGVERPEDAWWTGPLFAASANTLPKGHLLVEPYLFDLRSGSADRLGTSLFVVYGLAQGVAIGFVEPYDLGSLRRGARLSTSGLGDPTTQLQFRLNRPAPYSSAPMVAVLLQQTIPLSRFDHLTGSAATAHGNGEWTTHAAVYLQSFLWLRNGRILRMRLDLSHSFSASAKLEGASVYGTPAGFNGTVRTGPAWDADGSLEYSLSQRWVVALDVILRRGAADRVRGVAANEEVRYSNAAATSVAMAPAVEFSWSSRFGIVAGVRFQARGRETPASVMPTVAVNMVF